MPRVRKQLQQRHSHPELVDALAQELNKLGASNDSSIPTIYEEPQPYGGNLHVKVIWSKWSGVPLEERGAIIMDAYERAGLKDDVPRITIALGLTAEEARNLKIDY